MAGGGQPLRRHLLSIDVRINDAAKSTMTRCKLVTDLPITTEIRRLR